MSEAFARMHLRDSVRQDDVDHAIAVTIQSFVSCQKSRVKRDMLPHFEKYLSIDKDNFVLLSHVLSELETEHIRYNMYRDGGSKSIEIDVEELELRAREMQIHDLQPFLDSTEFKRSFTFLPETNKIVPNGGR